MDTEKPEIPPPLLLVAIVCDQVIQDIYTNKKSVIGVFDTIAAFKFPAQHSNLVFFGQLTNGRGEIKIAVKLVDIEQDESIIFQGKMDIKFIDIRQVNSVIFNISGIVFPHPGEYRFQIYAGTELLGERALVLREVEKPSGDKHE